jgi:hypothetical protein
VNGPPRPLRGHRIVDCTVGRGELCSRLLGLDAVEIDRLFAAGVLETTSAS